MSDGRIIIDTEIDGKGIDRGLGAVQKKLKGFDSVVGKMAKFSLAGAGIAVAAKKITDTIGDLTESYKTQIAAETQLEQAAKNNPLLDDRAVYALKDYASSLQSISTFGDEALIGFMGQLASAGRSQEEIQKIMAASIDIAASGTMSLDSAVRNLNKTFGGLSGELGETIPEIKSLTEEQLKNGAAVDLMASRYKGMAEEVAKATGSSEQLNNAMGDLKEELGAPFEQALGPLRRFFTELVDGWASGMKKAREYRETAMQAISVGSKAAADDVIASWEAMYGKKSKKKAEDFFAIYDFAFLDANGSVSEIARILSEIESEHGLSADAVITMAETYGLFTKATRDAFVEVKKQRQEAADAAESVRVQMEADKKTAADTAAAQAKIDADAKKRAEDRAAHIKKITEEREKEIKKIELQAKAEGKEVDQYEILQAYASSYVSLVAESNGLVKEGDKEAVALLGTVQQLGYEYENIIANQENSAILTKRQKELEEERREEAKKLREEMKAALDEISEDQSTADRMQSQLDALDEMYKATEDTEARTFELEQEYAEKRKILAKQVADARVAEQRQETIALLEIVNQFATQYNSIMSAIQTLATDYIENDAKVKTAAVEEQYAAGELSAEQYQERLTEINKKAAQEKYKADMWAWSANLAMGIANTALGATKALAEGGPISGPLLAALMIAAGGVQLASLIAAKPIPPSFATGGIVPGTSYTGDKVTALVNSGEMILNAGQQRALFDSINSGNIGGGTKVQVYNQASNEVKAEPQVTEDGIRIMIRKTVAKDMADGRFNRSYRTMQNGLKGTRLTN